MIRQYFIPIFLVFQIVFLKIIAFFPDWVEAFYSNGIYVWISKISRISLGKIPFSVGDIIYGVLILYILISIWRAKKNWKLNWKNHLLQVLNFLSVAYLLFHLLWGMNYYRKPLFEKMNIKREYSETDLYAFTEKLITKTNTVQFEITQNKNQKVTNALSQDHIFKLSQNGYAILAKKHSYFEYKNPSIKKSFFSLPLTYMGFGGYLNPFTNEAQVNDKLPMYGFPNVVCHEMAHQIGFASESECNFIGFLAGVENENLYFQYSAYANALRYCLSNIAVKNESKFELYKSKIHPGILANFKESDLFWQKHDSFIDRGFHAFYDQFLKLNQQEEGIESYSKFVDLLINFYKRSNL